MKPTEVMSVGELTRYIKRVLERDSVLEDVWIRGEISNFTHHTSGHMYFTLKDKDSRIKIVMFASYNRFLKFIPKDGTKALVRGSISVFERDGAYQMYAKEMQPDGVGSLYLAFEQLKAQLAQEGLFAPERKRPLPVFPKKVGVITSPTGAAVRDIITTIKRRYPQTQIIIHPAVVQGVEAPTSIVRAIRRMNMVVDIDVLIVGRGGGSIEELWAFNEEQVARAIAASTIPVISAVGHETDYTIADFVADVRAATPTAAAELAVPHYLEWVERTKQLEHRLHRALHGNISEQRRRLERLKQSYGLRQPTRRIEEKQQRLDDLHSRLRQAMKQVVTRKQQRTEDLTNRLTRYRIKQKVSEGRGQLTRLTADLTQVMKRRTESTRKEWLSLIAQLDALSPLKVMQRGFSLTYLDDTLIKSTEQIVPGDELMIRLTDGQVRTHVKEVIREENQDGS
ncbi:exodeoxyribonuclease VII large subunit [Brevibacillus dissolubilis]|uniref:exodeoxyribonuclease VII large subunit n=1 Tax=Brevibacillus dissolubilis TaxID=1844116 RepID=UPI001115BC71|nr:exodeoxyribonuclease VII large subunit [Brevibacillus dissolubilis]